MRASRAVTLVWVVVIAGLLVLEVAEITRFFTLPIQSALGDPVSFVLSLVFTTILALVGAIFIGIYISHRLLTPAGFTPFEEEMLSMRAELAQVRDGVEEIRTAIGRPRRNGPAPPVERKGPP